MPIIVMVNRLLFDKGDYTLEVQYIVDQVEQRLLHPERGDNGFLEELFGDKDEAKTAFTQDATVNKCFRFPSEPIIAYFCNMKKWRRIIGAVLLVAVLGGGIYLDSLLPVITGYAAKNLASAVFVSERNAEEVEALDLNFSLIRFTSNTVDYEHKTVTSRFLWRSATAVYRDGFGVTLLRGADANQLQAKGYPLPPDTTAAAPLPQGDSAVCARLELAKAFVDDQAYCGPPTVRTAMAPSSG